MTRRTENRQVLYGRIAKVPIDMMHLKNFWVLIVAASCALAVWGNEFLFQATLSISCLAAIAIVLGVGLETLLRTIQCSGAEDSAWRTNHYLPTMSTGELVDLSFAWVPGWNAPCTSVATKSLGLVPSDSRRELLAASLAHLSERGSINPTFSQGDIEAGPTTELMAGVVLENDATGGAHNINLHGATIPHSPSGTKGGGKHSSQIEKWGDMYNKFRKRNRMERQEREQEEAERGFDPDE